MVIVSFRFQRGLRATSVTPHIDDSYVAKVRRIDMTLRRRSGWVIRFFAMRNTPVSPSSAMLRPNFNRAIGAVLVHSTTKPWSVNELAPLRQGHGPGIDVDGPGEGLRDLRTDLRIDVVRRQPQLVDRVNTAGPQDPGRLDNDLRLAPRALHREHGLADHGVRAGVIEPGSRGIALAAGTAR